MNAIAPSGGGFFITHWGCSQDFTNFAFVSKNNLSGYFDYSGTFILFDNLDIE